MSKRDKGTATIQTQVDVTIGSILEIKMGISFEKVGYRMIVFRGSGPDGPKVHAVDVIEGDVTLTKDSIQGVIDNYSSRGSFSIVNVYSGIKEFMEEVKL